MGKTFKTDLALFSAAFIAAVLVLCANMDLPALAAKLLRALP